MYGSLSRRNVLTMILAGGMGERLYPLTRDRAKPAVPFGGRYRIVDFVINNFLNSGFFKLKVLTQFKSNSLIEHITRTWRLVPEIGQYVDVVPAQMRKGPFWFRGTADAVFQNLELIFDDQPEYVCVFGGDHIYKMDINQMLQEHLTNDADLTIATIPVPVSDAHHFGVVEVDDDWRVIGFVEKPKDGAKTIPDRPDMVLAPMNLPPAKFVFADAQTQRIGIATDSMVSDGVIISGGTINRSVLHPRVRVHSYSEVDEPILMDGVAVGRHSKIRRAIIDKGVKLPPY